jgi:hypothetical protein
MVTRLLHREPQLQGHVSCHDFQLERHLYGDQPSPVLDIEDFRPSPRNSGTPQATKLVTAILVMS